MAPLPDNDIVESIVADLVKRTNRTHYTKKKGLSTGAKAGIAIAVVIIVLVVIAIIAYVFWKKNKAKKAKGSAVGEPFNEGKVEHEHEHELYGSPPNKHPNQYDPPPNQYAPPPSQPASNQYGHPPPHSTANQYAPPPSQYSHQGAAASYYDGA